MPQLNREIDALRFHIGMSNVKAKVGDDSSKRPNTIGFHDQLDLARKPRGPARANCKLL